jgi:hypothetical protein
VNHVGASQNDRLPRYATSDKCLSIGRHPPSVADRLCSMGEVDSSLVPLWQG